MLHRWLYLVLGIALLAVLPACGDEDISPGGPSGGPGGLGGSGGGPGLATNQPPVGFFGIFPKPGPGGAVAGRSPITVSLNMCGSRDPDPGDDLRYEFWWDGRDDQPDQIGACKLEHTYSLGAASNLCFTPVICVWDRQPLPDHRVCASWKVCLYR